jgi:hypothetical protein
MGPGPGPAWWPLPRAAAGTRRCPARAPALGRGLPGPSRPRAARSHRRPARAAHATARGSHTRGCRPGARSGSRGRCSRCLRSYGVAGKSAGPRPSADPSGRRSLCRPADPRSAGGPASRPRPAFLARSRVAARLSARSESWAFRRPSWGRGSEFSPAVPAGSRSWVTIPQAPRPSLSRGRRGACYPPAVAAAGSGWAISRTPRKNGPRGGARRRCPGASARWPGRSNRAAAAAACRASPTRCTVASRPRDRPRSGRPGVRSRASSGPQSAQHRRP